MRDTDTTHQHTLTQTDRRKGGGAAEAAAAAAAGRRRRQQQQRQQQKKKRGRAKKTEIVTRSLRRSRQTKREILFASCQGNNSQGELEIN